MHTTIEYKIQHTVHYINHRAKLQTNNMLQTVSYKQHHTYTACRLSPWESQSSISWCRQQTTVYTQIKVNVLLNYRNKAEPITTVHKHNKATAADILLLVMILFTYIEMWTWSVIEGIQTLQINILSHNSGVFDGSSNCWISAVKTSGNAI